MSMVTGATSMSNNSAAAALAAAEEFRRAFNSHPLHTNPPSHHHSTTHSPLHQLPEDIPGLPRHRPNNSADFSPRSVAIKTSTGCMCFDIALDHTEDT